MATAENPKVHHMSKSRKLPLKSEQPGSAPSLSLNLPTIRLRPQLREKQAQSAINPAHKTHHRDTDQQSNSKIDNLTFSK